MAQNFVFEISQLIKNKIKNRVKRNFPTLGTIHQIRLLEDFAFCCFPSLNVNLYAYMVVVWVEENNPPSPFLCTKQKIVS